MAYAAADILPAAAPRARDLTACRVLALVALVVIAYRHSLTTLAEDLSSQSPLAYLGLVPFAVLGLCLAKGRGRPGELGLPVRDVDWMVGVPLLTVAGAIALWLPDRVSYPFWTNRLDLIGLPFFVAGLIAILFGARMLYRVRLPVALLLLAWPYPWQHHLNSLVDLSTRVTTSAVRQLAPLIGGARHAGGSVFVLGDHEGFTVSIGSACSGANGTIGFLLVGGAAVLMTNGRLRSKLVWLTAGAALMATLNTIRILVLFWVGANHGQVAALQWLHPVAGLVLLGLGSVVMALFLPGARPVMPAAVPVGARPPGNRRMTATALFVSAALAATLAVANQRLVRFDPFTTVADAPAAGVAAAVDGPVVGGSRWAASAFDEVAWAPQYFGAGAQWTRYRTSGPDDASAFMDVVTTDDLGSFSRFGLEACYRFHDREVLDSGAVDVGVAWDGQAIAFAGDERTWWSAVSWVWPVASAGGGRFERVTLLAEMDPGQRPTDARLDARRSSLVQLARDIVADRGRPRRVV